MDEARSSPQFKGWRLASRCQRFRGGDGRLIVAGTDVLERGIL
jgi:hypothetical protein